MTLVCDLKTYGLCTNGGGLFEKQFMAGVLVKILTIMDGSFNGFNTINKRIMYI